MKRSKPKSLNQNERSTRGRDQVGEERGVEGDFISAFLLLASETPPAAFTRGGHADDVNPLGGFNNHHSDAKGLPHARERGYVQGRGGERLFKLAQAQSHLS